jgi:hypothetical protein
VLVVLCCAVAPAVVGAVAGSAVGGWLGIALRRRPRGSDGAHPAPPETRLLMYLRGLLVALIVAATAAFVVGVSIERGTEPTHHIEAEEGAHESSEGGKELRPLGVDVEAWPFVAVAAVASLGLAAAAWRRPAALLLWAVAGLMLAFAVLDVREVIHQADLGKDGLAVLAAVVALLHLGATGTAGTMAA